MRTFDKNFTGLAACVGMIFLAACAGPMVDLGSDAHGRLLSRDIASTVSTPDNNRVVHLSLEEAIARGYACNLDARVAALESLSQQDTITLAEIRALPGVEASGGFVHRSNPGASSSRSVITGQQSLEPSQSTETVRRVATLEANWNLLDAALALADAAKADDEAGIARERQEKVIQNVERDVYVAYWRALAFQENAKGLPEMMAAIDLQMEKLDTAASQKLISSDEAGNRMALLSDRQRTLRDLHDRLQLAEIELKSMLSLPLDSTLVLTTRKKEVEGDVRTLLAESAADQEWAALRGRPEMREEILKKNITLRDTRREVYQSFPGINLLLSKDYDSNKFLVDSSWTNFSAKIVQSITNILTLPTRYRAAQNRESVADARRQALGSAVLAQVHIARARLQNARDVNHAAKQAQRAADRKIRAAEGKGAQGFASGQDILLARAEKSIEDMRAALAYTDLQDAYAAMNGTLARPVTTVRKLGGAA